MGALSNEGGRGQRNREEIGAEQLFYVSQATMFSQITLFLASFWSTFPREAVRSELEALVINAMIICDL